MTAQEYLLQYKRMTARIQMAESELERLRDERAAVSSKLDGMPRGSELSDRTARLATKIADKEMDIVALRAEALEIRSEILLTLSKLSDPRYAKLLHLRYVDGCTWEDVASQLYYVRQWVSTTLHDRALDALQELLDRT